MCCANINLNRQCLINSLNSELTLNLLTTTIVAPPSNASKWQMGFNSAFKGLNPICHLLALLGAHHILHVSRIRVKQLILLCLDCNKIAIVLQNNGMAHIKMLASHTRSIYQYKNIRTKVIFQNYFITNFNAQFSLFINYMFVTLLSSTCFEH